MERILSRENLLRAWHRVKANGGAAGVDGMTIAQFPAFARQHWETIRSRLIAGTYHPAPVRRVFIPKPNGDLRPLGIPTVLDRVIQQAIAQVLTPLFDPHFSTHSYGFRYGKRAHQAVRSVEAAAGAGYLYAVDCDLKSFFDTVKFDRLMRLLARRISDKRVLRLIGAYLRAGVRLKDGTMEATTQGVPQGGPLSPLLANIMLDPLDKELERRGLRFARYADDFLILVKSLRAAQRVMQSITRFVETRLKLVVNRQKSQAAPLSGCTFLGFQIRRGRVVWTDKALKRFKERIQQITSRSRGVSIRQLLHRTPALRGGLAELLWYQPSLSRDTGTGPMAATAGALVLLETVETAAHTAAASHPVGHPPGGGVQSQPQSAGLLVDGRDEHCAASAGQSLADGTGSAELKATMDRDALRQAERAVQSAAVNLTGTA